MEETLSPGLKYFASSFETKNVKPPALISKHDLRKS
jgi:hypothetical protein